MTFYIPTIIIAFQRTGRATQLRKFQKSKKYHNYPTLHQISMSEDRRTRQEDVRSVTISILTPTGSGIGPHTTRLLFSSEGRMLDGNVPRPAVYTEIEFNVHTNNQDDLQSPVFIFTFRRSQITMQRIDNNNADVYIVVNFHANGEKQQVTMRTARAPDGR